MAGIENNQFGAPIHIASLPFPGELDDTRLIEGITGEKTIYKRRGEQDPEPGAPQEKPKRVRLVVDVSGSMYRFNGHDQRLDRMMESTLMVMEALEGYSERLVYDIVGHSGEENDLPFTSLNHPPTNEKERLDVLKTMHAHAQFCMSGDHTLSGNFRSKGPRPRPFVRREQPFFLANVCLL